MSRGGARAHANVDRDVARLAAVAARPDGDLFASLPVPLFLVDGNHLLWRAAHSSPAPVPSTDGRDITPLFRFLSKLRRAAGSYGVFAECIVCFDGSRAWEHRTAIDPCYKANRSYEGTDLAFMGWLPEIRAALAGAGVAVVEVEDAEADDAIATITARAGDRPVRIWSTDRDYYQLVSATVHVVNPRGRPPVVDARHVEERYGVSPARWCDLRALAGDPSDGIAGLPGIGMTKGAELLLGGRSIEDLGGVGAVADRLADVLRWRELIRLRTDVQVGGVETGSATPRLPSASALCAELGVI